MPGNSSVWVFWAVSDEFHVLGNQKNKIRHLLLSTEIAVHLSSRILNSGDPSIIIGSAARKTKCILKLVAVLCGL